MTAQMISFGWPWLVAVGAAFLVAYLLFARPQGDE